MPVHNKRKGIRDSKHFWENGRYLTAVLSFTRGSNVQVEPIRFFSLMKREAYSALGIFQPHEIFRKVLTHRHFIRINKRSADEILELGLNTLFYAKPPYTAALHTDGPLCVANLILEGQKTWVFFPTLEDREVEKWYKLSQEHKQQYEKAEMKREIERLNGVMYTQKAGEMLYFGKEIWHEVRTDAWTVSWATSLFTVDDLDELQEEWNQILGRESTLVDALKSLYK